MLCCAGRLPNKKAVSLAAGYNLLFLFFSFLSDLDNPRLLSEYSDDYMQIDRPAHATAVSADGS